MAEQAMTPDHIALDGGLFDEEGETYAQVVALLKNPSRALGLGWGWGPLEPVSLLPQHNISIHRGGTYDYLHRGYHWLGFYIAWIRCV